MSSPTEIIRSWDAVHPIALPLFVRLHMELQTAFSEGATRTQFGIFETYRTPERQEYLFKKKKTKARAWQSAHQFGLGVDFVPLTSTGDWSWTDEHDYPFLKATAERIGLLVPIAWDRVHVQHPAFQEIRGRL